MLEWMTTDTPPALLLEMLVVFARYSPPAAVDTMLDHDDGFLSAGAACSAWNGGRDAPEFCQMF